MANLDTVVAELPSLLVLAGDRVKNNVHGQSSIKDVCHIYPDPPIPGTTTTASMTESDADSVPLSVAHGLFLHPHLLPFLRVSGSDYDGNSNSGKVRGTSPSVIRHLQSKKNHVSQAKDKLLVNTVFLDELWLYIEDLSQCSPVDEKVWKALLNLPLIPMLKGGKQWLGYAEILKSRLFVLYDAMDGRSVGGVSGEWVDEDVVECLETALCQSDGWIADISFLYRFAFPSSQQAGARGGM